MCEHVGVDKYKCKNAHPHVCLWRSEVYARYFYQFLSTLFIYFFLRLVMSLALVTESIFQASTLIFILRQGFSPILEFTVSWSYWMLSFWKLLVSALLHWDYICVLQLHRYKYGCWVYGIWSWWLHHNFFSHQYIVSKFFISSEARVLNFSFTLGPLNYVVNFT